MDGVVTWIHSDHLHSATILTDAAGAEIRRLAYRAFGEELENTGSGAEPTYSYTGKERDHSGLMYYGARYYDPALSRFITPDTIYDTGTQGLNRYSYALNNPIRYNDPSGHMVAWTQESVDRISSVNQKIRNYVDFLPDFLLDSYLPVTPEDVNSLVQDMVTECGGGAIIIGPGKKAAEEVVEGIVDHGKKVAKEALEEGSDDVVDGALKNVEGIGPNKLKARNVDTPTKGEGGAYQYEIDGKTKTGSTQDFYERYNGENITTEYPQTRTGPAADDSAYEWTDRRQRRFDEQYLDDQVPESQRYRAPNNPKRPVSREKWDEHHPIFGYGEDSQ